MTAYFLIPFTGEQLTDMLKDAEIAQILSKEGRPKKQAEALMRAALSGGGRDNITVVVIRACL